MIGFHNETFENFILKLHEVDVTEDKDLNF